MKRADSQILVLVAATLLGAGFAIAWTWTAKGKAEQAQRRLRATERSWQALSASEPAPTAEMAAAWDRRVADLKEDATRHRQQLGESRTDPVQSTPAPTQRAEAFFAIAQFIEAQRVLASKAGVGVPDGYTFGFSAYSNSGPVDAELGIVHRQRLVVESLLQSLWSSGARELTRVQREAADLKVRGDDSTPRGSRREGRPEDYFQPSPARERNRAGIVDTLAFRVGFVGKTATLRRVLGGLQALPMPLVVRAVEVEPLDAEGRARGGARSLADLFRAEENAAAGEGASDTVPIIASNDAEFLVTVVYLDFNHVAKAGAEPQEDAP